MDVDALVGKDGSAATAAIIMDSQGTVVHGQVIPCIAISSEVAGSLAVFRGLKLASSFSSDLVIIE